MYASNSNTAVIWIIYVAYCCSKGFPNELRNGYDLHPSGYGKSHMIPCGSFLGKVQHLQVHEESLQDSREITQSVGHYLPALLLHQDLFLTHLGDPPSAFWQIVSYHQWHRRKQILQGLHYCQQCPILPTTIVMQIMCVTTHQTGAVQSANHK